MDMSAIEWLHTLTPLVVICVICNFLAGIKLADFAKSLKFSVRKKPRFSTAQLRKTSGILYSLTAIGWVLLWLSTKTLTPILRVDLSGIAQLFLFPTLPVLAYVACYRLLQRDNALFLVWCCFTRCLKGVAMILVTILPVVLDGATQHTEEPKPNKTPEAKYAESMCYINHEGGYTGEDGINNYGGK